MHRRLGIFTIAAIFLLLGCPLTFVGNLPSTATVTAILATESSTAIPASEASQPQPVVTTDWLSQLQVIHAGNWARLQLLETFPAEMPLNHSAVTISSDGKVLTIGSSRGASILFFNLVNREHRWVDVNGVRNVDAYFNKMEYLSDGTLLANADGPYMIYHIDTAGNVLSSWDGISFALSADRKIMAHSTEDGITLVEIASNTPLVSLQDGDGMYIHFLLMVPNLLWKM